MKKRIRKTRLIRAGIQLLFFILAPALFSTAFAGVRSIFDSISQGTPVEWNSFLDITGILALTTILFGRHFCGYACAFGSLGDALYEAFSWFWIKVLHRKKKPAYPKKSGSFYAEDQICDPGSYFAGLCHRSIRKASGYQSLGCIFHASCRKTAGSVL